MTIGQRAKTFGRVLCPDQVVVYSGMPIEYNRKLGQATEAYSVLWLTGKAERGINSCTGRVVSRIVCPDRMSAKIERTKDEVTRHIYIYIYIYAHTQTYIMVTRHTNRPRLSRLYL